MRHFTRMNYIQYCSHPKVGVCIMLAMINNYGWWTFDNATFQCMHYNNIQEPVLWCWYMSKGRSLEVKAYIRDPGHAEAPCVSYSVSTVYWSDLEIIFSDSQIPWRYNFLEVMTICHINENKRIKSGGHHALFFINLCAWLNAKTA